MIADIAHILWNGCAVLGLLWVVGSVAAAIGACVLPPVGKVR